MSNLQIMKSALLIVFIMSALSGFCQNGQITGKVIIDKEMVGFNYLTIHLKTGDSTVKTTFPDSIGHFTITDIRNGSYNLVLSHIGVRSMVTENLNVSTNTKLELELIYPSPCSFAKGPKPACPLQHSNGIIPIFYGLPSPRALKKAKKGTIHLGGCITTDCDPTYFCKVHNMEI